MLKKVIALMLVAVMALSLAACGGGGGNTTTSPQPNDSQNSPDSGTKKDPVNIDPCGSCLTVTHRTRIF